MNFKDNSIAGIYGYFDKKRRRFVYEGKDSYINKSVAHKRHLASYNYNAQPINKVLQNNPNRYKYVVLKDNIISEQALNDAEIFFIKFFGTFRPETGFGFNFTKGGDGTLGYKHSDETKKKMSESKLKMSDETKKKMSESKLKMSDETKEKISKSRNSTGFYNVTIGNNKSYKQGYCYRYRWRENGKMREIKALSLDSLQKKVLDKGLKWKKL